MSMADLDKHIIFVLGLRGHVALGTLSETYFKDAVFEISVSGQNLANKYNVPTCIFLRQDRKPYHV